MLTSKISGRFALLYPYKIVGGVGSGEIFGKSVYRIAFFHKKLNVDFKHKSVTNNPYDLYK